MTTATTEDRVWTRADVERDEDVFKENQDYVQSLKADEARLNTEIANCIADRQDVTALQKERAAKRELRVDIENALVELQKRITERRADAIRGEAVQRFEHLATKTYPLATQAYDQYMQKVLRIVNELADAVATVHAAYEKVHGTEAELLVLRDVWPDLPAPELKRAIRPDAHALVPEIRARLDAVRFKRIPNLPLRLDAESESVAHKIRSRIAGTPTDEIVKASGITVNLTERERAWQKSTKEAESAARRAESDRVNGWFRKLLADGPVRIADVRSRAQAAGIPLGGFGNGWGVADAKRSLDLRIVYPWVKTPSSQPGRTFDFGLDHNDPHYALPDGWDAEAFGERKR